MLNGRIKRSQSPTHRRNGAESVATRLKGIIYGAPYVVVAFKCFGCHVRAFYCHAKCVCVSRRFGKRRGDLCVRRGVAEWHQG